MFIIGFIDKLLTFLLMTLSISLSIYSHFFVDFPVLYPIINFIIVVICILFLFFSGFVYIYTSIDVGSNLIVKVIIFPLFLLLLLNFFSLPDESFSNMDKRLREVSGYSSKNVDNKFTKSYTILNDYNGLSIEKILKNIKSYKVYYIESKDMTFIIEAETLKFGYLKGNVLETNNLIISKDLLETLH